MKIRVLRLPILTHMKRIFLILLSVTLCFTLTLSLYSCNSNDDGSALPPEHKLTVIGDSPGSNPEAGTVTRISRRHAPQYDARKEYVTIEVTYSITDSTIKLGQNPRLNCDAFVVYAQTASEFYETRSKSLEEILDGALIIAEIDSSELDDHGSFKATKAVSLPTSMFSEDAEYKWIRLTILTYAKENQSILNNFGHWMEYSFSADGRELILEGTS